MTGRGLLGKWGPNHAADPIVSRYLKHFLFKLHLSLECFMTSQVFGEFQIKS